MLVTRKFKRPVTLKPGVPDPDPAQYLPPGRNRLPKGVNPYDDWAKWLFFANLLFVPGYIAFYFFGAIGFVGCQDILGMPEGVFFYFAYASWRKKRAFDKKFGLSRKK